MTTNPVSVLLIPGFVFNSKIEQFLSRVKNSRTESNVNIFSIGKSSEGRDLIVAKVTFWFLPILIIHWHKINMICEINEYIMVSFMSYTLKPEHQNIIMLDS